MLLKLGLLIKMVADWSCVVHTLDSVCVFMCRQLAVMSHI